MLDLKGDRQLARLLTPATEPSVGIIFPGMHDDVYMLSSEAGQSHDYLHRVYASLVPRRLREGCSWLSTLPRT